MNIVVQYSCTVCAVRDVKVEVPVRESPDVDVVQWMKQTIARVAGHHRNLHPYCLAKALHDLKIPMQGVEWVGGPPIQ